MDQLMALTEEVEKIVVRYEDVQHKILQVGHLCCCEAAGRATPHPAHVVHCVLQSQVAMSAQQLLKTAS